MMNNDYETVKYQNAIPSYLENSQIKPFYHALEGISFKTQPDRKTGPLEKIFSNKSRTSKATVKALLEEIELRENVDSHLLYSIEEDICKQSAYLSHLKSIPIQYSFELAKSLNKTKGHIEKNIISLEQEKRKELLDCWRDMMLLKKYLMSSLTDYWSQTKKREMLTHDLLKNENLK